MAESILIVDDEESVRRTFLEWVETGGLDCDVEAVADAEAALLYANQHTVDLAILDWNLGQGADGLQLLQDLREFHPDIVAIMVTGFAHQATPLHALRMGVRDYLDKNQDLNRETFLAAVRRQLKTILPVKRRRQLANTLFAFREAVEKVLPLVQSSAAMSDRVPLPDAIRSLFRYLLRTTEAAGGVLVARHISGDGTEYFRAYGSDGEALEPPAVPFARSLAASVVSMQDVCAMNLHDSGTAGSFELQPFEERYQHVLAAPVRVAAATLVVLELFDKGGGKPFSEADRQLLAAASDFGAELLRQAMSERRTQRALFNAVEAALQASASLTSLSTAEEPPPASVMDKLREGLAEANGSPIGADASLRLAEAVRVLAVRHGPAAVQHCIAMVESLRKTLDEITGG